MQYVYLFMVFAGFGFMCLSGGGSLTQFYIDELVIRRAWMTLDELGNFMAVSQSTPGPIGVNLATFIGFKELGLLGGLCATIGLLAPSFFMMTIVVRSYSKWSSKPWLKGIMYGIKPVTAALVFTAFIAFLGMSLLSGQFPADSLAKFVFAGGTRPQMPSLRWEMVPVFICSIILLQTKKAGIFQVILLSAAAGAVLEAFK